jgi:hypothetical protein
MTPYFVQHKPNIKEKRRSASLIHYYVCSNAHKNRRQVTGHMNRVLARKAEEQILKAIWKLGLMDTVLEAALEGAMQRLEDELSPEEESLKVTEQALHSVDQEITNFLETIGQGRANDTLITLINGRIAALTHQRAQLQDERRRYLEALKVLKEPPDPARLQALLMKFSELVEEADSLELQRLLRLVIHRIDWNPDGSFWLEVHYVPKSRHDSEESHLDQWFVTNVWNDCPWGRNVEPIWFEFFFTETNLQIERTLLFSGSDSTLISQV